MTVNNNKIDKLKQYLLPIYDKLITNLLLNDLINGDVYTPINNLTRNANYIINNNYIDGEIIWVNEKIDHDGYDKYGPKSNLYDLYIISKKNDTYKYSNYHFEDWFDGMEEIYELDIKPIILN